METFTTAVNIKNTKISRQTGNQNSGSTSQISSSRYLSLKQAGLGEIPDDFQANQFIRHKNPNFLKKPGVTRPALTPIAVLPRPPSLRCGLHHSQPRNRGTSADPLPLRLGAGRRGLHALLRGGRLRDAEPRQEVPRHHQDGHD